MVNPKGIDACLKMLESKRVNIVFANEYAGWGSIKELYGKKGLSKFKTLDKAIQKNAMYMIVSKTYPNGKKILEKFNEALGQLKKEKVIQGILDDYLK